MRQNRWCRMDSYDMQIYMSWSWNVCTLMLTFQLRHVYISTLHSPSCVVCIMLDADIEHWMLFSWWCWIALILGNSLPIYLCTFVGRIFYLTYLGQFQRNSGGRSIVGYGNALEKIGRPHPELSVENLQNGYYAPNAKAPRALSEQTEYLSVTFLIACTYTFLRSFFWSVSFVHGCTSKLG